jgi:WD40 repeat protein
MENGHLASGSSDGELIIWNVDSGSQQQSMKQPFNPIHSLAQLKDGSLATGSFKTITLWNPNTGAQVRQLTGNFEKASAG